MTGSVTESKTRNRFFESVRSKLRDNGLFDGLEGASAAFVFSQLGRAEQTCLWICETNREAETIAADLRFFTGRSENIILVPGFEADPYGGLSPHPAITEARAAALARLLTLEGGFVVAPINSIISKLPSPRHFQSFSLHLEAGQNFPIEDILQHLKQAGYVREEPVSQEGEYARRGGILDVFSPLMSGPVRIEFFGEEVESIRLFDPATQRSSGLLTCCDIWPMREQLVLESDVSLWQEEAPRHWNEVRFAPELEEKLQFTENGEVFNGYEYVFPLVWNNQASLIDYLEAAPCSPKAALMLNPDALLQRTDRMWSELQETFRERLEAGDLVLPPEHLFFEPRRFLRLAEDSGARLIRAFDFVEDRNDRVHFDFLPAKRYEARFKELVDDVETGIRRGDQLILVVKTPGTRQRLVDIFGEYGLALPFSSDFSSSLDHQVSICEGPLSAGFSTDQLKLKILVESDLFPQERTTRATSRRSPDAASVFRSDFRDLKEGDFVVHVEHGIARFEGLRSIELEGQSREFVELVYRENARLFVPVDRLDLLQKYSAGEEAKPRLDRLGGASWERTKQRIKASLRDLAEDLLKLYARRELAEGHAFAGDDSLMREFETAFEFQETPDQLAAIESVKQDMESPRPMDRLVCGDVGYGKTEVAMRAAFKAANDGFQVALLAPTTVLAAQHLKTFRQRFSAFPVKIDMLSRFRSRSEQKEIIARARKGTIDILIGTHRLLSDDVQFHNLGLLIVDEEQRFGVAQKERIKKMRAQVDVLALSATPIPRTLNMSILGLRDLSIVETPPKDRLAIQTVVVPFSDRVLHSAIDLELKREGQVFLVHNSVETIYSIADLVRRLVPEARVAVAHGQMAERQLEEVMLRFVDREFDVLVCTTIIENGLDIPRANTLIVNRADHFGLSQLYQLRGRVGRSHRRAYAYLLIPSREELTPLARKRLAAIREFSDLGAGFRIAAHDLEIRGTGNLLGAEQHGHISAVGFELYTKLLQQAVSELRGEGWKEDLHTSIDLGLDIQIPAHYIEDENLRLWLYKRISLLRDDQAMQALENEVVDRFGKYPRTVANLLEYARLRLQAAPLRIASIEKRGQTLHVTLGQDSPVDLSLLVGLIQARSEWRLSPKGVLSMPVKLCGPGDLLREVGKLLSELPVIE